MAVGGQLVIKYVALNFRFLLLSHCLNIKRRKSLLPPLLEAAQKGSATQLSWAEVQVEQKNLSWRLCRSGLHGLVTWAANSGCSPPLHQALLWASEAKSLHSGMEEETRPPLPSENLLRGLSLWVCDSPVWAKWCSKYSLSS